MKNNPLFEAIALGAKSGPEIERIAIEEGWDRAYIAAAAVEERREWFELLWKAHAPFADPNFIDRAKDYFQSAAWEMYLSYAFLQLGIDLSSGSKGPDWSLGLMHKTMHVEAIVPTHGTSIGGSVPPIREGVVMDVPHDRIQLRILNALDAKQKQFKDWEDKELIDPSSPKVIAINVDYLYPEYPIDNVERVCFGLGDIAIPFKDGKAGDAYIQSRQGVQKNNVEVPTGFFLSDKHAHISGVLYSLESPSNSRGKPPLQVLHLIENPKAEMPIPNEFIQLFNSSSYVE